MCLFFCPLFTSQCNGLFLISRGAVKTGGAAITMTTTGGEDKVTHQHKVGRWSYTESELYKLPTNISFH